MADVLAVLDQLELDSAVLVGHSLGAYIVARLAAEHPQRVKTAVLVDGGLTIPGSEGVDPQEFADAFLGPALARLRLTFGSPEEYYAWWRRHPAFTGSEIADDDLIAYADHDLDGEPPELHSAVAEAPVRADAGELATLGLPAQRLTRPGEAPVRATGVARRPQPDAAARARAGVGSARPRASRGDPRARRQPLHDHAWHPGCGGGGRDDRSGPRRQVLGPIARGKRAAQ